MMPDLWPSAARLSIVRWPLTFVEACGFTAGLVGGFLWPRSEPLSRVACVAVLALLGVETVRVVAARRVVRHTTLVHAHLWAGVALLAWWVGLLYICRATTAEPSATSPPLSYLAAVLVISALVAVLGARRPGVWMWHFVVATLVVVFCLPLAQRLLSANAASAPFELDGSWATFLLVLAAVAIGNYLPTANCGPALLLAVSLATQLGPFTAWWPAAWGSSRRSALFAALALCAAISWALRHAGGRLDRVPATSQTARVDRIWLAFRDLYGFAWARRVLEPFNHATAQRGSAWRLEWRGLTRLPATNGVPRAQLGEPVPDGGKPSPLSKTGSPAPNPPPPLDDSAEIAEAERALRYLLPRFVTPQWLDRVAAGTPF